MASRRADIPTKSLELVLKECHQLPVFFHGGQIKGRHPRMSEAILGSAVLQQSFHDGRAPMVHGIVEGRPTVNVPPIDKGALL